ncbi:TonB-dependent receptor [Duganella sp. BJB488]|uniref:TonB-dependent receptor n=1 Tax=unclassified Duganella TaxID=2636909 RepID=UPI000E34332E|nr:MULTISPECIES: TonB-dependent receptor [unclassified Duganella]RFP23048.1 TonB-dependent receptor [Duganella sp. BJB489]RFP24875.1 TonB-dependent receptor [Duganella sp. BJB488]RFP34048.1 TonB-dependent receptor [Duganella sp. BJB480]
MTRQNPHASRQRRWRKTPIATALSLGLLALASAHAQTASTDKPAEKAADKNADAKPVESVVVTGYRYAIEKSLDQKRNANAIVDVVTAEDIGKFPDKNVADALQRVPGVIIDRSGGEGKNVSVRGLSSELTLTQLNGNYIATAESNGDPTRSFNYMLMPANMLSSAELFKTPEARIDEGGIGGTVILHTRRPLEVKSGSGFVSAEGTWADTTKKTDGQFSGQYAWHDEANRFGVLVGYTQQKRTTRTMGASTENWQWYGDNYKTHPATDVNGKPSDMNSYWWGQSGFNDQNGKHYTNFMMPTSVDFDVKSEDRERKGGQLTLQAKPMRNLTLTGNYFRFDLSQNSQTNTLKIPEWNLARYDGDGNWPGGRLLDGLTFDRSGTIVTGAQYSAHAGKTYYCSGDQAKAGGLANTGGFGPDDCTIPTPQITGSYNREKALSQTADLEAEWHGESLDATFKAGRTWAGGGPELQFGMPIKPRLQNADGSWTLGNYASAWSTAGKPTMTFSPQLMDNLQKGIGEIDLGSTSSSWTRNSTQQKYAQADLTWHSDSKWLDSLQFGGKYRDGGTSRSTGNNYWVCKGANPADYDKRYQAGCDATANKFQPQFLYSESLGNLAGGINASAFPAINYPAYIAYLNQTYGAMQTRNEDNFVYNVNEKIASSYLQANIKTDRLRGNVGLRVVRTRQHADSTDRVDNYNDYFFNGPNGAPAPCQAGGLPAVGAPAGSGCTSGFTRLPDSTARTSSFVVSSLDRSYTDVLPSLNLAYDLRPDLLLRVAASKVVSRPSYSDIASPGGLQYYSQEYVNDRRLIGGGDKQGWFGEGSNKQLEPYKANQFDVGLEWYFQRGSVLGADLFRKNVSNFAVPVVRDVTMDIGGKSVTVQNYSTSAGGRNGVSQGIEMYAQHTLASGLGFQVNYTYNKTNQAAITLGDGTEIGKSQLVGSAKNQANVTVFYETDQYLLRASYNRRGEVVGGLVNGLNVYQDPYSQVDVNVAYNVTKQLSLTASVLNLTRQEASSHLGSDTKDRFYSNGYTGRIAYFGANYKF